MRRRLIALGGLAAAGLIGLGCSQAENVHGTPGAEAQEAPAQAQAPNAAPASANGAVAKAVGPALAEYEVAVSELVELKSPAGWTSSKRGAWTVWASGDQRAKLALSVLESGRSVAAKRGELEGAFGVSDVRLTDPQAMKIGPDQAAAQGADGACRFASGDGAIAFATVDIGGGKQAVIAYAFEKDAPAELREQAMAAVASLRKKK